VVPTNLVSNLNPRRPAFGAHATTLKVKKRLNTGFAARHLTSASLLTRPQIVGLCVEWNIHPGAGGSKWRIGIPNPRISGSEEATMFGYGIIGTLVIIVLIIWIVRAL
jgi:hypothetical protein